MSASMNTTRYVLAIDLGTSACKVALVTTQGDVVAYEQEATEVTLLPNGGAEQDPDRWWEVVGKASRRLIDSGVVPVDSIDAVCATAQWAGTVALDADGKPLRDAIIWMDTRGADQAAALSRGLVNLDGYGVSKLLRWIRITGGAPGKSGTDPVAHILWLREHEPDTYRDTKVFLEPKDYLNFRMTGRYAASFDSIALLWVTDNRDLSNVKYHPGLLAATGIPRSKLPDLLPATDILGPLTPSAAAHLGVPASIPVVVGTPDVPSAAIGSGATRDFQGHLYVGTSSWLTCHVPFKKTDVIHNLASLPSPIPGRYLIVNVQEAAGACLAFLSERVFLANDGLVPPHCLVEASANAYRTFDTLAASASPGSGGVLFTPWLYGERTPVENATIRGGLHHLSLSTTRADIIRSVFEGVALNSRWLLQVVEQFTGHRMDPLRFIGGGARSAVWSQIFADVLNRTVEIVKDPVDANARGAAMIGAVALKSITFDELSERIPTVASFVPDPANRAVYDDLFHSFLATYKRDRRPHKQMARAATNAAAKAMQ